MGQHRCHTLQKCETDWNKNVKKLETEKSLNTVLLLFSSGTTLPEVSSKEILKDS